MALEICPACQTRSPVSLEAASAAAAVDYYRCAECCFVFSIPKHRQDGPVTPVTFPEMALAWRAACLSAGAR